MKKSTKSMIAVAAVAGLFSGSLAVQAHAAKVNGANAGKIIQKMDSGKHDCKGKNLCKGQGGCKSGDNGCKGKNDCKGKGGCNTNKPM